MTEPPRSLDYNGYMKNTTLKQLTENGEFLSLPLVACHLKLKQNQKTVCWRLKYKLFAKVWSNSHQTLTLVYYQGESFWEEKRRDFTCSYRQTLGWKVASLGTEMGTAIGHFLFSQLEFPAEWHAGWRKWRCKGTLERWGVWDQFWPGLDVWPQVSLCACYPVACIQGSDTSCMYRKDDLFVDSNLSKNGPWNELSRQTGGEPNAMSRWEGHWIAEVPCDLVRIPSLSGPHYVYMWMKRTRQNIQAALLPWIFFWLAKLQVSMLLLLHNPQKLEA